MKSMFTKFKSTLILSASACLLQASASAATFTAIASGNFSSSATWSGGIVPPSILAGDDCIIPPGFTILLDQDLSLTTGASLSVNGTLNATSGKYLSMTTGTLTGVGTIMLDSFYTAFTNGFTFTGSLTANTLASANASIATAANVTVNNTLRLMAGTFNIVSGSLTMANNANIVVSGGVMTVNGGSVNLTNGYNVMYINNGATAGVELTGNGLTNVTIDVPATANVNLTSDLTVGGQLTLTSGSLDLNGQNLTFKTSGNLAAAGSGNISSSSNSDITINSSAGLSGAIRFSTGGNTVDDFTINLGNSTAMVTVDGGMTVNGQLQLQNGRLNIGTNKLELATNATVTGGSANSFVVTGTGGTMSAQVATNTSQTFHVGTSTNYAPAVITSASSSASSNFMVGVNTSVMQQGTSGAAASATQPVVNATWFIASSATAGVNVTVATQWSADMEVNSFNRSKAYISHYTNNNWDVNAATAATTTGSMYSMTRTGITSFSPFAVFDESAKVSVASIEANSRISLAPNPATNTINIAVEGNTQPFSAAIYNISGQQMAAAVMNNQTKSMDISNLPTGMYYIRITGAEWHATQKFIKQ